MTVKPRCPQLSHTPAYRYGTLVNQACEASKRIIEDARKDKTLGGEIEARKYTGCRREEE